MYHVVKNNLRDNKKRIKLRVRSKIFGTSFRPRISIFRSNKYLYAQLIDDSKGHTIASISSLSNNSFTDLSKLLAAFELGKELAKITLEKGITEVVFDRNKYLYHGRVAKFAEGARAGGLKF